MWSEDIERVLEDVRINCVLLSNEHKSLYFDLKENLKYYRLPVIVLSGLNSIFSVGLQPYADQGVISMLTCILALTCSVIGSVELFLQVQKQMEDHLISQREFYLLSVDIHKTLKLDQDHRPVPAKDYLERLYAEYCKLMENSPIAKRLEDKLCPIPSKYGEILEKPKLVRSPLSRSLSMEMEQSVNGGV